MILVSQEDHHTSIMSNPTRTPSLPLSSDRDWNFEVEEEEEEPIRMSDLIREAMPMPSRVPTPTQRLQRTPSLPSCREKEISKITTNFDQNGCGVGRLSRKVPVDSSNSLPEKGPIARTRLTRTSSVDPSMFLLPKNISKGMKENTGPSKNRPQRKMEPVESKYQNLDKSKSKKNPSDVEIEELQGFKDLGFSFEKKDLSPKVTRMLPALQRTSSLDSNRGEIVNARKSNISEAWRSSSPSSLSAPRWDDRKGSSSEDIKAQIKFWAQAVASSNVR